MTDQKTFADNDPMTGRDRPARFFELSLHDHVLRIGWFWPLLLIFLVGCWR